MKRLLIAISALALSAGAVFSQIGTTSPTVPGVATSSSPTFATKVTTPSVVGGTSGTSTLTLDGDSTVAGSCAIDPEGRLTIPNGTIAKPGLTFAGSSEIGFVYGNGGNNLGIVHTGDLSYRIEKDVLIISSQAGAVQFGSGVALQRYSAGVSKITDASNGIRGLLGGGAAVASATALPVPTGNLFHVTGTTTITSITSTNFQSGVCITLIFDDVLTFTDGSNLKLAGDFVTTADDVWRGCYDGTNWYESSRSVN